MYKLQTVVFEGVSRWNTNAVLLIIIQAASNRDNFQCSYTKVCQKHMYV